MRRLAGVMDLGAAFDASPNAYLLMTADLVIVGANQAYLDLLNTTREQIVGRPIFEAFDSGPGEEAPENVRQVRGSMLKAIATGQRDHLAMVKFSTAETDPDGVVIFRDRFWSATHTPIKDAQGRVTHLLQHTTDVTELERLQRQIGEEAPDVAGVMHIVLSGGLFARAEQVQRSNRQLESERGRLAELLMQAPGFVAILSGSDHTFEMANAAYTHLVGRQDILGLTVRQALPEVAGQGFIELLDHVYATGEPYEARDAFVQLKRRKDQALHDVYLNFVYQPIRNAEGDVVGIFVQGHEVTEQVMANERQRLMIDELNHRVKNTLATVQSIAMQTARTHQDPASFAETFQSRLMALSHTHNLLTRSHWEGADLRDVLQHETEAHGPMRVLLNGPPVALAPFMAVSLGMIFHELSTNAAKYGALSSGEGRVFVDWFVSDLKDRRLLITWREEGGPQVLEPERRGFGSRLIERNIRHDLAGEAKLVYASDGFIAEISIPLDRSEA